MTQVCLDLSFELVGLVLGHIISVSKNFRVLSSFGLFWIQVTSGLGHFGFKKSRFRSFQAQAILGWGCFGFAIQDSSLGLGHWLLWSN